MKKLTLSPFEYQNDQPQGSKVRRRFSDFESCIQKKEHSFDSAFDFEEELKKYGLTTVLVPDEEEYLLNSNSQKAISISPITSLKKTLQDLPQQKNENNFGLQLKTAQERNYKNVNTIKAATRKFHEDLSREKNEIEEQLKGYKKYIIELGEQAYKLLSIMMRKTMKQVEIKIPQENKKYQKKCQQLQFKNKQLEKKIYQSNILATQFQRKNKTSQLLLEEALTENQFYREELKRVRREKEHNSATNMGSSYKKQNEQLHCDLEQFKTENYNLKLEIDKMLGRNQVQKQKYENDKQRYVKVIKNFQKQISTLESDINKLKNQKINIEYLTQWQQDMQGYTEEIENQIYLEDIRRQLNTKKQSSSNKYQQMYNNNKKTLHRVKSSPEKQMKLASPRIAIKVSPPNGYHSPRVKSSLRSSPMERLSTKQSKKYFHEEIRPKYFKDQSSIGSKIENIEKSLNRQLFSISKRY